MSAATSTHSLSGNGLVLDVSNHVLFIFSFRLGMFTNDLMRSSCRLQSDTEEDAHKLEKNLAVHVEVSLSISVQPLPRLVHQCKA